MDDEYLIHPERITDKPLAMAGTFAPADLERLQDSLASGEGELRYRITATLDPHSRKRLSCIIEGFVFLTCQTSLEAFRHEIMISDSIILVDNERQLPAIEEESDAEDYLVADEPLDIRDLVEDAVLLALPMIPRKSGVEVAKAGEAGGIERPSPFAALASLKQDKQT